MAFRKEPAVSPGNRDKTAVLLVNLGTPDEPTAPAVRRYLKEFLSDPRVVEIPAAIWWPILNGVVLPIRSSRSAAKYATIWTADGSPLKVWTSKQAALLRGYLAEFRRAGRAGPAADFRSGSTNAHSAVSAINPSPDIVVEYAMRYGNPSIASVLDRLRTDGCERILVLPLYPQYSATTTASTSDAVNAWCAGVRNLPEIRFVKHYHDDPAYIAALAGSIRTYWEKNGHEVRAAGGRARLVMSFHGIPKRNAALGDPYADECLATGRLLTEKLGLSAAEVAVSFQSRFGRAEWLQPYTMATLEKLAKEGVDHVDICCPGFPADCLETLEEIAIEGKACFLGAGGKSYRYLPCLDDHPAWIAALATIAERHLGGWSARPARPA